MSGSDSWPIQVKEEEDIMKVREMIAELIKCDMENEVLVSTELGHTGIDFYHIEFVSHGGDLNFPVMININEKDRV